MKSVEFDRMLLPGIAEGIRRSSRGVAVFAIILPLAVATCAAILLFSFSSSPLQGVKSGWLYVLDFNQGKSESQVLIVDPQTGEIIRKYRTGYAPEMALSPDGTRLYIAQGTESLLSIVDTARGAVLKTMGFSDRAIPGVLPAAPNMVISPDGRWLYIKKLRWTSEPRRDEFSIATFDTEQGIFLPDEAPVPSCGAAHLLPAKSGQQLYALCSLAKTAYSLLLGPSGAPSITRELGLPAPRYDPTLPSPVADRSPVPGYVAGGVLSPDRRALIIVMSSGRILEVDLGEWQILRKTEGLDNRWAGGRGVPSSPDGTRLYVSLGQLATRSTGMTSEILVVDTKTFQQLGKITTSHAFWSLTISNDGRQLYAVSPDDQTLMVIDTTTFREIRSFSGIGVSPARVIVAP